jgi:hypothetical protein
LRTTRSRFLCSNALRLSRAPGPRLPAPPTSKSPPCTIAPRTVTASIAAVNGAFNPEKIDELAAAVVSHGHGRKLLLHPSSIGLAETKRISAVPEDPYSTTSPPSIWWIHSSCGYPVRSQSAAVVQTKPTRRPSFPAFVTSNCISRFLHGGDLQWWRRMPRTRGLAINRSLTGNLQPQLPAGCSWENTSPRSSAHSHWATASSNMALSSRTLWASAAEIFCPGIPFGCSAFRTGLGGLRTPGIGCLRALVIVAQLGAQCCARARPVSLSKADRERNTSKHRPRFLSRGLAIRSDLAVVYLISLGLFAAFADSSPSRPWVHKS